MIQSPREQQQRAAVRAQLEAQAEAERRPPCVKCSECDGFHHTSFEYAEFEGDDGEFSHYGCKHCDARFESCPGCGGPLVDGTCHGECGEDQP